MVTAALLALSPTLGWAQQPVSAGAQTSDATSQSGPTVTMRLDVQRLMTEPEAVGTQVADEVWDLSVQAGRRLVQLPMILDASGVESPVRLTRPDISINGGRFIAWRIPTPSEQSSAQAESDLNQADRAQDLSGGGGFRVGDSRLAELFGGGGRTQPRDTTAQQAIGLADRALTGDALGLPRLAREVRVSDGVIGWDMERSVPGATLKTGDLLYLLKLDFAALKAKEPEKPARQPRQAGEDSRVAQARQREADNLYRQERLAFLELSKQVRDLPEAFEEPMPEVVYAVFEVTESRRGLSLAGPEIGAWSAEWPAFDLYRAAAGAGGSLGSSVAPAGGFSGDELTVMIALQREAGSPSVLGARVAAAVLSNSGWLSKMSPNDQADQLARAILAKNDGPSRRMLIDGLASVVPPTRTTAALLLESAKSADPVAKLAALRSSLLAGAETPGGLAQAVRGIEQALNDPQGPDPAELVNAMLALAQEKPESAAVVAGTMSFDRVPADRLEPAVATLIRAGSSGQLIASEWLDSKLLGSVRPEVQQATLRLLAQAHPPRSVVSALGQRLRQAVSSRGKTDRPAIDLTVAGGIPLPSTRHAIFRALQSGDPQTRALAWSALPRFSTVTDAAQPAPPTDANAPADDPLSRVLSLASQQQISSPALVRFLAGQPADVRSTAALIELVAGGEPSLAARAGRSLLGSNRPIAEALVAAEPDRRGAFATRLYAGMGRTEGPVTELARDEQVARWLGAELAEGRVPSAGEFVEPAGGETRLLELAGSPEEPLAHAAIAALGASVGGDAQAQYDLIDALGKTPERTAESVTAGWTQRKQQLRVAKLQEAAGNYRLIVLAQGGHGSTADTAAADAQGAQTLDETVPPEALQAESVPNASEAGASGASGGTRRVVVGIVELVVAEGVVKLAGDPLTLSVPEDKLAIRIDDPQQLAALPNDALTDLPINQALGPIDLLPADGGAWAGQTPLNTGGTLTVILEPDTTSQAPAAASSK